MKRKDAGTIFNPVMFLVLLMLSAQLLIMFVEYRRVAWLSGVVTNVMTDALLGAGTLNEYEVYHYGRTGELEILYPEEKYHIFQDILCEELRLMPDMGVTDNSVALIKDGVKIKDFKIYSVQGSDITVYDFDERADYTVHRMENMTGVFASENGEVIEDTALVAEIGFTVEFLGMPVEVCKYHMVDLGS